MRVIPLEPAWHARALALKARAWGTADHSHRWEHLRWRHLDHPGGGRPLYLLAVEGETALGQWAAMIDRVTARGQEREVAWMMDLYVAPEHRDTMAAASLFRAGMADGRPLLATGASPAVTGFFQVFRWHRMAVVDTFYRVFRPGPLSRLAAQAPAGHRAAAVALLDRALPLAWAARDRLPRPRLEPVRRLGPAVDRLYARLRDRLGVSSVRSAEVLRWRLDQRPCGAHRILALPAPGDELRGYIVIKLRRRRGVAAWAELADFLVDPEDGPGFDALVEGAAAAARAEGVDFVRLRTSLPQHGARLRPPAWIRRDRAPMDDLFVWPGRDAAVGEALRARPWAMTALCGDQVDSGLDEWTPPAGGGG